MLRVRILGSAAGGGFPQWNCACRNCAGVRAGSIKARSRTQSQVAVSADGLGWHLLNASPDLRAQIETFEPLRASRSGDKQRGTPIQSITLTNADLDHALGLLLLRESQSLRVFSTRSVQKILVENNAFFGMLEQRPEQLKWTTIESTTAYAVGDLTFRPLFLPGGFPRYSVLRKIEGLDPVEAVLGLSISARSGASLLYLPGVAELTDALVAEIGKHDLVLLDGTFWSDDELSRVHPGTRTARQMGHVPLSGPDGTLARLSATPSRKVFLHINNTNPILDEASPEHRAVRDAGFEIAFDGWEATL